MAEISPQLKNDEQFPLLMVSGGGDSTGRSQQSTVVSSVWNVTNLKPKNSWRDRWPEFLSACWMTFILLGISFLVFYAIGMMAYRQQPFIILKCNASRPASDVYLHQIIPHDSPVPFMGYSNYLAAMATQYPSLRFNVFFLQDDTFQSAFPTARHTSLFYTKLLPILHPVKFHDEFHKRVMRDFQRRVMNVNITVMRLSKFMAMTPLKYKWRTIPTAYLPFYARVFSVWQNGGVGIDLATYNNQYNVYYRIDERLSEILKQHNKGIKTEGYTEVLNKIDREEENEFFLTFYGLIDLLMNETRSLFNKTSSVNTATTEKETLDNTPLIRTHRNKRDGPAINISEYKINQSLHDPVTLSNVVNTTVSNGIGDGKGNDYKLSTENVIATMDGLKTNATQKTFPALVNYTRNFDSDLLKLLKISDMDMEPLNKSDTPQVVLMYDVSVMSGGDGAAFLLPETIIQANRATIPPSAELKNSLKPKTQPHQILTIESNGLFLAASSKLHPFLGHLLSAGCRRSHPKFAIQDSIYSECSTPFRNDIYCNNIYVL